MAGWDESLIAFGGAGVAARRAALHALVEAADGHGPVAQDTPGTRNQRLLRLHAGIAGGTLEACAACPCCDEKNEFDVPVKGLLALPPVDREASIALGRSVFRLPRVADLELRGSSAEAPALRIARACRLSGEEPIDDALLAALGTRFDAADPAAAVSLEIACAACGMGFPVAVDVALLVGEACARAAENLLRDVDALASAYGWNEAEILAVPAERRRRYVSMIAARRMPGGAQPRPVELVR